MECIYTESVLPITIQRLDCVWVFHYVNLFCVFHIKTRICRNYDDTGNCEIYTQFTNQCLINTILYLFKTNILLKFTHQHEFLNVLLLNSMTYFPQFVDDAYTIWQQRQKSKICTKAVIHNIDVYATLFGKYFVIKLAKNFFCTIVLEKSLANLSSFQSIAVRNSFGPHKRCA